MRHYLQFGRFGFNLQGTQALVMGILNITPDSFSDAGQYQHLEFALSRAEQMIVDGVDIIDIGGESSRPGAPPLPLQDELAARHAGAVRLARLRQAPVRRHI